MRLPRLTTRRLLALVAAAALYFGGAVRVETMLRDRERHLYLAAYHSSLLATNARLYAIEQAAERRESDPKAKAAFSALLGGRRSWAAYHARMRDIHRRAARYPWLPVPPDPPRPE